MDEEVGKLLTQTPLSQLVEIYRGQGRNFELRQPLLLGDIEFGSIRIGVSTLLMPRSVIDRTAALHTSS